MPRNVEIKALLRRPERQRALARQIADKPAQVIEQRDVFFHGQSGRLKLRFLAPDHGQLIAYHRPDQSGPSTSRYRIATTDDPKALLGVLEQALGVRAEVNKTRTLLLAGRTRIHLDQVARLGHYLELEVVLAEGEDPTAGRREAEALMRQLEIAEQDLVEEAYVDLLRPPGADDASETHDQ